MSNNFSKFNNTRQIILKVLILFCLVLIVLSIVPRQTRAAGGYNITDVIGKAKSLGVSTSSIDPYLSKLPSNIRTTGDLKNYLSNDVKNNTKFGFDVSRSGIQSSIETARLVPKTVLGFDNSTLYKKAQDNIQIGTAALAGIDKAEQQTNKQIDSTINKIDKAEQMYGLMDTVGKIPSVLGLIDDIKNIGKGDASPAQILGTLEKAGRALGFPIPPEFKQAIGMFGQMGSGIDGAASVLQSVITGGGGGLFGSASNIPGASAAASEVMANGVVGGVAGSGTQANGLVNAAADKMKDNQQIIEDNKVPSPNICDSMENATASSGSEGVPVVEQPGDLLGYTKTLANLTTQTRKITQKTCEITNDILELQKKMWTKLNKGDPKQWTLAKDATKTAAENFKTNFDTKFRTKSNDLQAGQTSSGAPTIEQYTREQEGAARIKALAFTKELIDDIQNPYLKQIYQDTSDLMTRRDDLLSDPKGKAAFMANKPDEDIIPPDRISEIKDSSYWTNLGKLYSSTNNPIGIAMNLMSQTAMMEAKAADDAQKTLIMGNGIVGKQGECVFPYEFNGKKTCLEWIITQPAKFIGDIGSFYATALGKMATESDLAGKKGDPLAQIPANAAQGQPYDSMPLEQLGIDNGKFDPAEYMKQLGKLDTHTDWKSLLQQGKNILSSVCALTNSDSCNKALNTVGTIENTINQANGIVDNATKNNIKGVMNGVQSIANTLGGDADTGDFTDIGSDSETFPSQPEPDPTVTFTQKTIDLGNGIKQATLDWSSENTINCVAGNDWLTFGDENNSSIESAVEVKEGEEVDWTGEQKITYPALFDYSIGVSGGLDSDGAPNSPQKVTGGLFLDDDKNINQKITYKPNITNLKGSDYINLSLNGSLIQINAGNEESDDPTVVTAKDIIERMSQAISMRQPDFNRETTSDSLIISQKIETNGTSLRSANYEITCYNEAQKEVSKTIKLNFF